MMEATINNLPLVSVIIPVYNTAKYLQRCINGLEAQSYKNLELIFVNDGSNDDSVKILKNSEEHYENIIIINQENKGPSAARNAGLEVARGKWVLFCDSDDSVQKEWAERLVINAEEHPNSLVICGLLHFYPSNGKRESTTIKSGYYRKDQYYELIEPGMAGSVCIKAFLNSIIQTKMLRFCEDVRFAEDALFVLDYMEGVDSFYLLEDPLYCYYHYDNDERKSLSVDVTHDQMLYVYEKRLPFIAEKNREAFDYHYFGNIWKRFQSLSNEKGCNRKEKRQIISDSVFQRILSSRGEQLFDSKSLFFLKRRIVFGFELLQYLSRIKNRIGAQINQGKTNE